MGLQIAYLLTSSGEIIREITDCSPIESMLLYSECYSTYLLWVYYRADKAVDIILVEIQEGQALTEEISRRVKLAKSA